ncbi:DMT family transporter [Bradyrhizobium sp. 2S1]|uniref:DMT family transporter n=1 Tax=Bradyrhizobium sp. 2S1 TaxID=1404429 RepID=UPI00289C07BD|nr:DMT family transporter [Bradyrhizobium sp. 2S1]
MAAAMASFTANDTITKAVAAELNIGEILLVRGLVAMVLVAALAWYRDALRSFATLLIWPVGLRVMGEIGGTLTYLSAIAQIPLANASAIFQALPLVITLGAALVFGEPVGWRRWLAIAAGFIGVLVIVRPGAEGFSQAALLALASVGFCAVRDLATRRIPKHLPTVFITLLTTVTVTVTTAGAVVLVPLGGWRPPSGHALGLLVFAGADPDRLSMHHRVAAHRRYLGGGAVPLLRAVVGDAAWLSRLRPQARRPNARRRRDHRRLRPLCLLPRAQARQASPGRDRTGPAAGWAMIHP